MGLVLVTQGVFIAKEDRYMLVYVPFARHGRHVIPQGKKPAIMMPLNGWSTAVGKRARERGAGRGAGGDIVLALSSYCFCPAYVLSMSSICFLSV